MIARRREFISCRLPACLHRLRPSPAGGRSGTPAIIQVGQPFAEHLHTWPGVLDADKGPIHFRNWKFAAQDQSLVGALSIASLPRPASALLAAAIRNAAWLCGCSRNAIFAHVRASS